jgi:hypothetical protein
MHRWAALAVALALFVLLSAAGDKPSGAGAATLAPSAWCGGSQSWQSARQDVGRLVRVRARVVRAFYAFSSSGRPTFLDLGHAYPSRSRLTILIWGRDRVNFPRAPERMFRRGTLLCGQGVVSTYRGVPQIEVALWDAEGRLLSF